MQCLRSGPIASAHCSRTGPKATRISRCRHSIGCGGLKILGLGGSGVPTADEVQCVRSPRSHLSPCSRRGDADKLCNSRQPRASRKRLYRRPNLPHFNSQAHVRAHVYRILVPAPLLGLLGDSREGIVPELRLTEFRMCMSAQQPVRRGHNPQPSDLN